MRRSWPVDPLIPSLHSGSFSFLCRSLSGSSNSTGGRGVVGDAVRVVGFERQDRHWRVNGWTFARTKCFPIILCFTPPGGGRDVAGVGRDVNLLGLLLRDLRRSGKRAEEPIYS